MIINDVDHSLQVDYGDGWEHGIDAPNLKKNTSQLREEKKK